MVGIVKSHLLSDGQMLLDRAPQVFAVEMGVDFGREDAFVPQHLLYLADRGTAFQQVRRERVAEGVGADALLDSGPSGPPV